MPVQPVPERSKLRRLVVHRLGPRFAEPLPAAMIEAADRRGLPMVALRRTIAFIDVWQWTPFATLIAFAALGVVRPELLESALIDGANYITIFFKIYFPLSTPIIATIALYFGVQHWNDWFQANLYITQDYLKPMQNVLLGIVNEAKFAEQMASAGMGVTIDANMLKGKETNVRSITMATMFVTIIPIIIVYPFLQRYFVKGIMIGSVKG